VARRFEIKTDFIVFLNLFEVWFIGYHGRPFIFLIPVFNLNGRSIALGFF